MTDRWAAANGRMFAADYERVAAIFRAAYSDAERQPLIVQLVGDVRKTGAVWGKPRHAEE